MKPILLKKAKIFDPSSRYHMKVRDIVIADGVISEIRSKVVPRKNTINIESNNLCVSPGWLDIGCFNGEPGYEHREDLDSLKASAIAGGYTALVPYPNTQPVIDSKAQIEYLIRKNSDHPVEIYPLGALTKSCNGRDMAELMDLYRAGAVGFSDGPCDQMSEGQIQRSLEYLNAFGGKMIYDVQAKSHSMNGHVNEGTVSIKMGLEGIPEHHEKIAVESIVNQLRYTGGHLILQNISLGSVLDQVIKASKELELSITVAFMNLSHLEDDIKSWDANYKVLPPLRMEKDRRKLCKAIEKGQVNVITSNHVPHAQEEKDEPFGLSPFGASTLETVYASLSTYAEEISVERVIYCLSNGPREALGLPINSIEQGSQAELSLFDPSLQWQVFEHHLRSKSKNNPYIGQVLTGRVLGIIKNNQYYKNE